MKAKLTFDLSDPEDKDSHLRCVMSGNLCSSLWDFDQWLRDEIKYKDKDYQDIRDKLYAIMHENNINIDELWK